MYIILLDFNKRQLNLQNSIFGMLFFQKQPTVIKAVLSIDYITYVYDFFVFVCEINFILVLSHGGDSSGGCLGHRPY